MATYQDYINLYAAPRVLMTEELINNRALAGDYMFRTMLREEYSVTGKWESIVANRKRIAADYVAMDSSLPLKTRGVISTYIGDIPKIGTERWLNETQLKAIDIMIAMGRPDAEIAARLTDDIPEVIFSVEELNERAFLSGFSNGAVVIPDNTNVGVGISVNFGYLPSHDFGVAVIWNAANAATSTPIDDIRRVRNQARMDGNQILHMYMDYTAFAGFAASEQVRQQWAFYNGFTGSNIPMPSVEQLNAGFATDSANRLVIHLIDRQITLQANGEDTVINPWAEGIVILTDREEVGSLVWTDVAESRHRAPEVMYQTAMNYTLVSVKRHTDPSLSEHTKAQAMAIPIITGANRIYRINSQEVQG